MFICIDSDHSASSEIKHCMECLNSDFYRCFAESEFHLILSPIQIKYKDSRELLHLYPLVSDSAENAGECYLLYFHTKRY